MKNHFLRTDNEKTDSQKRVSEKFDTVTDSSRLKTKSCSLICFQYSRQMALNVTAFIEKVIQRTSSKY